MRPCCADLISQVRPQPHFWKVAFVGRDGSRKEACCLSPGLGRLWLVFSPRTVCACGFARLPLPDRLAFSCMIVTGMFSTADSF